MRNNHFYDDFVSKFIQRFFRKIIKKSGRFTLAAPGANKFTFILQMCFTPLNISYSVCHGDFEGACKILLNSVQLFQRRCEDIHTYIFGLFIYI